METATKVGTYHNNKKGMAHESSGMNTIRTKEESTTQRSWRNYINKRNLEEKLVTIDNLETGDKEAATALEINVYL